MSAPPLVAGPIRTALAEHAAAADGDAVWPEASWRLLRESGALGWCIPPEYGGSGAPGTGYVSLGIVAEEIGRADFNVTLFLQLSAISAGLLSPEEPAAV